MASSNMLVSSHGRSTTTRKTVYVRNNNSSSTKENIAGHTCFVKNINYSKEGAYAMTSTLDRKVRATKYTHRRQRSDDTDTIQGRVRSLLHNPIQTNGSLHHSFDHGFSQSRPSRRSHRRNGKETYPHRRMAERNSSLLSDEILHSGYLKKQGGAFKTWQRRWFVLSGDYLYYYNKEDDSFNSRPLGAIPLKNNKVEKHPHNPDDPGKYLFEIMSGGHDNSTRILNNHESFLLWASSSQEADEWIQHIRRRIYGRKGGGIFGQSLLDTLTNESYTSTKMIPSIVEQCCDFLRELGLQEEGIFRLPGRAAIVRELQEQFDCGEKPDFHQLNTDIHTVASLFKMYLRQLPEPVIPWEHYENIYNGIRLLCYNEPEGRQELIRQIALLPRTNYNLLKYVCEFLHEVQTFEGTNRMNIMNLATVFGPNIFRPMEESTATLMESTAMSQKFVHLLIQQHDEMFPPNHLINFSPNPIRNGEEPIATPVPPPRKMKSPAGQPQHIDLLNDLKQSFDNRMSAMHGADVIDHHGSLLIDFDSEEDISQMMMGRVSSAAVNKRTSSSADHLGLRDSIESTYANSSSTLEESGSTDGQSTTSSRNASFSSFHDLQPVIRNNTPGNRESLVIFNPSAASSQSTTAPPKKERERPASISMIETPTPKSPPPVSPRKSKALDLTATTPEASSRHSMDMTFQYSNLQEQVRALKADLIEVKDERDQKLLKMKMRCEGLQLKLSNEETLRKAAEERNKQLLSQLNAFIDEYGPQLSTL